MLYVVLSYGWCVHDTYASLAWLNRLMCVWSIEYRRLYSPLTFVDGGFRAGPAQIRELHIFTISSSASPWVWIVLSKSCCHVIYYYLAIAVLPPRPKYVSSLLDKLCYIRESSTFRPPGYPSPDTVMKRPDTLSITNLASHCISLCLTYDLHPIIVGKSLFSWFKRSLSSLKQSLKCWCMFWTVPLDDWLHLCRNGDCRFELLRSIGGFSGLSIQWRPRQLLDCLRQFQLPLKILQQDLVYIHNRTNLEIVWWHDCIEACTFSFMMTLSVIVWTTNTIWF